MVRRDLRQLGRQDPPTDGRGMTVVFNTPPGWPAAPVGWVPPPGWSPPRHWPAAPAGWVWYLELPSEPSVWRDAELSVRACSDAGDPAYLATRRARGTARVRSSGQGTTGMSRRTVVRAWAAAAVVVLGIGAMSLNSSDSGDQIATANCLGAASRTAHVAFDRIRIAGQPLAQAGGTVRYQGNVLADSADPYTVTHDWTCVTLPGDGSLTGAPVIKVSRHVSGSVLTALPR
jgi:hypothetical protein